jgi:hypothetical protein
LRINGYPFKKVSLRWEMAEQVLNAASKIRKDHAELKDRALQNTSEFELLKKRVSSVETERTEEQRRSMAAEADLTWVVKHIHQCIYPWMEDVCQKIRVSNPRPFELPPTPPIQNMSEMFRSYLLGRYEQMSGHPSKKVKQDAK